MSEILNLAALCRCCHSDGLFKDLYTPHTYENNVEIYSIMLKEALCIELQQIFSSSISICDNCIKKLREALCFKKQVIRCEEMFLEYCKNEQSTHIDDIKSEAESIDSNNHDSEIKINNIDIKEEFESESDIKPNITIVKVESKSMKKIVKTKKGPPVKYDPSYENITKTNNGIQYFCKKCKTQFDTKTKLRHHIIKTYLKLYKCKHCLKSLKGVKSYKNHEKTHANDYQCKICRKKFPTRNMLKKHNVYHVSTCDICKKIFKSQSTLNRHKEIHLGLNKKHFCECGTGFNDVSNLRIHVRTVHEKKRPFQCDYCNRTFTLRKHIIDHIKKHTVTEIRCKICNKSLSCEESLKKHYQRHSANFQYMCLICNGIFKVRAEFVSHLRTHQGQRPHVCHICGKDFLNKYTLNRHIESHSGLRPYICDFCSKSYTQKSLLGRHMKIHMMKPDKVQCSVCEKYVTYLDIHMKSHNKTLVCVYCNKKYSQLKALNRHIKIRHFGVRRHECDKCDKSYSYSTGLKRHKLQVHSDTSDVTPVG